MPKSAAQSRALWGKCLTVPTEHYEPAAAPPAPTGDFWSRQLTRSQLLTAEEEWSLGRRIQAGTEPPERPGGEPVIVTPDAKRAFDALVTANIKFAYKVALDGARDYHMPVDDLTQEANQGLMAAAKRFDPARGLRFLTYALWWIKSYLGRRIINDFSMVKVGTTSWQRRGFFKALRGVNEADTVMRGAGESRPLRRDRSLTTPGAGAEDGHAQDGPSVRSGLGGHEGVAHDPRGNYEDLDADARMHLGIGHALQRLDPREREIIVRRYLTELPDAPTPADVIRIKLGRPPAHITLAALAIEFEVSRERIRQLELRALDKIRRALRADPVTRALLREARCEGISDKLRTRATARSKRAGKTS